MRDASPLAARVARLAAALPLGTSLSVRSSKRAHSPSSIALAKRCRRAWWHCYGEKIREPEVTWADIASGRVKPQGGQRSKAIGTQVHAWAEVYLRQGSSEQELSAIDWQSDPGRALQALVPLLPPKGSVHPSSIERAVWVVVEGVLLRGFADVTLGGPWDHKTTKDIRKYALLPHDVAVANGMPERSLKNDLQACVYALWYARRQSPLTGDTHHATRPVTPSTSAERVSLRWNYTETGKVQRALPVVQSVTPTHARYVVRGAVRIAKEVETYRTREDAPPDITACDDYGGCWYRREGHCKVPRPLGMLVNRTRNNTSKDTKELPMATFKEMLAAKAAAGKSGAKTGKAETAAPAKRGPGRPAKPKAAEPGEVEETEEVEEEAAEAEADESADGEDLGSLAAQIAALLPAGSSITIASAEK